MWQCTEESARNYSLQSNKTISDSPKRCDAFSECYWFHIYCVMWPESIGKSVGYGSSKHSPFIMLPIYGNQMATTCVVYSLIAVDSFSIEMIRILLAGFHVSRRRFEAIRHPFRRKTLKLLMNTIFCGNGFDATHPITFSFILALVPKPNHRRFEVCFIFCFSYIGNIPQTRGHPIYLHFVAADMFGCPYWCYSAAT